MVSPHHVVKITTALSAVALTASVAVTPAYALQDIAIEDAVAQSGPVTADNGVVVQSDDQSDDQTGDQQSQDGMPEIRMRNFRIPSVTRFPTMQL